MPLARFMFINAQALMHQRYSILIPFLLLVWTGCVTRNNAETIHYYQAETQKPYEDVLAELEIAITEHNFRITGHSKVGTVIRKREGIDFPDYDTIQFCNLTHAKKMLQRSPRAIRHMPCNVVLYTHDGRVIVITRLLPFDTGNEALNVLSSEINSQLKAIVDFAVEE